MTTQIEPQILRLAGVLKLTGVSRSTIYKLMSEGAFVEPISLGML